jgi:hypothetical protein
MKVTSYQPTDVVSFGIYVILQNMHAQRKEDFVSEIRA